MSDYAFELYHHGKKGQQWGVRNAEWYPIDAYREHMKKSGYSNQQIDKITDKINLGKSDRSIRNEIKKQTKIKNKLAEQKRARATENLAKARSSKTEVSEKNIKPEDAKKKAIDSGNLEYVKAHYSDFTTNEINDVINRHAAITKVNSITADEKNKGKQRINNISNTLGTMQDISGKVANVTSNAIRIYNTGKTIKGIVDSVSNTNTKAGTGSITKNANLNKK